MLLKSFNPKLKVFFYLATDLGGFACYSAYTEYMSHPEWFLSDDFGNLVNSSAGIPLLDFTNPVATDWWANIPLNGTDKADIIDGVL